jgi:hypothetical protein
MLWKSGWIPNSLKYRVEKDIRETIFKNDVFLRNRWSLAERLVVLGSKHVFIANLVIFLIASACFFLVAEYYTQIQNYLPQTLSGLGPLVEFQSTIFGAQVTLLGLIFPLVIAFIGILLQGKSSNESMWVIYRHNSGFMLVGFSALTLSASFVLLKVYEPWLTHQNQVAASISITAWFLTNLVLSGWFLWKTVAFLSLNSRMTMVVKYVINEVAPSDIKNRLLVHHGLSAINIGLLLSPKNESLEVNTFSAKDLENSILHQFSNPRRITNVWYRILNLGVWFFSLQAKLQKSEGGLATLSFPFSVDNRFANKFILAKTNCDSVNWISKVLIKIAVRTTTKPVQQQLNVDQVIGALFGQLEDSLKDNNSRLFDSAKENLIQFHRDIESSMFFINDNGEPDNWLLLPKGLWLGQSFLDMFVGESLNIAKEVTRRIQDDSNYYESWCYLYPRLFSPQKNNIPTKIAEKYIDGHYLIWGKLMSWMGGFEKSNNVSDQQIDHAIKHFVGSWEHWNNFIDKAFRSVKSKDFLIASRHLNDSCCMIVYACKYNNNGAATWATDILSHWLELFSNRNIRHHHYGLSHELITIKALELDCGHSLLKSLTFNNDFSEVEATTIGLRNYWTDLRCLTAAYLLATSHNKNNGYKNLINALVYGKRLELSGSISINHSACTRAKDILGVYLRQNGSWESQSDYQALMEQHLDRLARIEEPEWVSGRIYSSFGTKSELYLPDFFKVMGIGLTVNKFRIDPKWLEFLKSDSISQTDLESTISSLKSLKNIEESTIKSVSDHFEIELEESNKKSQFFIISIEEVIIDLESKISEKIINAAIDKNRLLHFGEVSSGSNFTLSDGPTPVTFFDDIDYKDDFNSDLVVKNIVDYRKIEVSQGIEVNRSINEDEWLNDIIYQQIQVTCFQQLLRHNSWKEAEFEDAKSLILRAVEDSQSFKNKNKTPVMFIGPWAIYSLIDSSKWKYGREDDKLPFDISVESNKEDEYICHLAGIEVYKLPFIKMDFSILLSKEAFRKINIKRFGDGRYVEATFKTEKDSDLTGTLSLSFGVECEFNTIKCFKYISRNPDE